MKKSHCKITFFCIAIFFSNINGYAESQRIISLAPNVTELLFDIGAEQQIVATVEYSDHPQAAKSLTRVGDVYQLDWERILRLQPDAVVAWQGGTPQRVIARVKSLGLPLVLVQAGKMESIASQLRQLGVLTGRTAQAEEVADIFLDKLRLLKNRYQGRRSIRVFFEIDHRPLYTINGKQIISDAISLCGGENIFSELDALAPQISVEAVLKRDPEVMVYAGSIDDAKEAFSDWRRWSNLYAVKYNHLVRIDPDLVSRPTPRMLQGIEQLCEAIDAAR